MITILIADDQPLLRKSLGSIIDNYEDIDVISLVENGKEASEKTSALKPDIALLDIEMPIMDGISALRDIKINSPKTKVIILTTFDNEKNVTESFLLGADAYISKEVSPDELVNTIRLVHSGFVVFSSSVKEILTNNTSLKASDKSAEILKLSDEEIEIVKLIIDGKTNKGIANILNYTEGTVKNKVSRIYDKLGINDRLKLAIFAMEHGIA